MIPLPGAHRAQLLVGEIVDGSGAQLERCLNFGHDRYSGEDEIIEPDQKPGTPVPGAAAVAGPR